MLWGTSTSATVMPATTSARRVPADMGNQRRKGNSAVRVVFMDVFDLDARHRAAMVSQPRERIV
jgi:hypothetical protein